MGDRAPYVNQPFIFNPYRTDVVFGILIKVVWNEFTAKVFHISRTDSIL